MPVDAACEQGTRQRHGILCPVDHEHGDDAGLAEVAGERIRSLAKRKQAGTAAYCNWQVGSPQRLVICKSST